MGNRRGTVLLVSRGPCDVAADMPIRKGAVTKNNGQEGLSRSANGLGTGRSDVGATAGKATPDALRSALRMGRDAFGRSQIFGDPVRQGDTVVIPVGRMRGGAGGGTGSGPVSPQEGMPGTAQEGAPGTPGTRGPAGPAQGEGSGYGWGMDARATGAYVIRGGEVSYKPAVDVNRIVVAGVVGLVAVVILVPRIVRAAKH